MIHSKHKLSYCDICENNCCNGSDGKVPKGINCDCSEAYEHQTIYSDNSDNITFAETINQNK